MKSQRVACRVWQQLQLQLYVVVAATNSIDFANDVIKRICRIHTHTRTHAHAAYTQHFQLIVILIKSHLMMAAKKLFK